MYPNIKQSIALLISLFLLKLIILWILTTVSSGALHPDSPIIHLFTIIIASFLVISFAIYKMDIPPKELRYFGNEKPVHSLLKISFCLFIITISLHILLSNILNLYYYWQNHTLYTPSIKTTVNINLISIVTICLVAPLAEEIIFRGIVLRGLLHHYPQQVAIIISAILFAIVHLNPAQLLPTLITGYFFGWLYVRSQALSIAILAHIFFNVTAYFIENSGVTITGINFFPSHQLIFVAIEIQLVSILFLFVSLLALNSLLNNK